MAKDNDILEEARERFQAAQDGWAHQKKEALKDLEFGMLGVQWPPDVEEERSLDGRPCLVINDIPASIRQVVNEGRQNRPSIKVRPVDSGADVKTADVFSGLIKNIESQSNASVAYDVGLDRAASMGFGFVTIESYYSCDSSFEQDLKICPVMNPLAVDWDPSTEAMDSSDWRYAFISELLDKEDFEREYPGAQNEGVNFSDDGYLTSWFMKDQVRVARYWAKSEEEYDLLLLSDGKAVEKEIYEKNKDLFDQVGITVQRTRKTKRHRIHLRKITGAEVLEETSWRGTIIPVVPVYGECVNVEGMRHFKSMIRDAKDAQRMFNLSRSTVSEIIGRTPKTPWLGPEGTFSGVDAEKWPQVNQKVYPYITYKGQVPPQRVDYPEFPIGAMNDAMAAADDKRRIIGVHAVGLGQPDKQLISGVAKRMERSEGDVGTFHFIDNQSIMIRGVGHVLLEMIPQVYSTARIVRILGDDGVPESIAINQDGGPNLCTGRYDLTVEAGPSFATRREEAAETLSTFISAVPQAAPILGPLMVKMMDFPDQEKTVRLLTTLMPPEARAIMEDKPPPPPGPPPELVAQQQKFALDEKLKRAEFEQNLILAREAATHKEKIEIIQANTDVAVKRESAALDRQFRREEFEEKIKLSRWEAEQEAELAVFKEQVKARALERQAMQAPPRANGGATTQE